MSNIDKQIEGTWKTKMDSFISTIPSISVSSNYKGENSANLSTIAFYRHIRNAISHSKCCYTKKDESYYVTFSDEDKNRSFRCSIKMSTMYAGKIMEKLQELIIDYLKTNQIKLAH